MRSMVAVVDDDDCYVVVSHPPPPQHHDNYDNFALRLALERMIVSCGGGGGDWSSIVSCGGG
eukprot:scaffold416_cov165-Skeletonema_dohrnii-CCMP3373.AAC.2